MPATKGNKYAKGNRGGVGGPSKYKPSYVDIARRLCARGNTDEEIGVILGVAHTTIIRWKLQHEEFALALKRTKDELNELVEGALFKKAMGYYQEVEKVFHNGKRMTLREWHPPDTGALRLWLQNRMPAVYREKMEHTTKYEIGEKFLKLLDHIEAKGRKQLADPKYRQGLIDKKNAIDLTPTR